MPFVQKTAQFNVQNSSSAGTAAITTTQNNDAVLTLSYWNSTSNAAPTWSDSKGNTPCSVDVTGVHSSSGSSFTHASVGRVKLASAGASHSWTISMPSSSYCEGNVVEWQGMDSSPLDQTATDTASAGDGDMAPTTGVTTVANEVVFAVASLNTGQTNSGVTDPPSGYTSIGVQSNDTITIGYEAAYKEVAATGAQSATWTFNSAFYNSSAIATYKLAPAASPSIPLLGLPYDRAFLARGRGALLMRRFFGPPRVTPLDAPSGAVPIAADSSITEDGDSISGSATTAIAATGALWTDDTVAGAAAAALAASGAVYTDDYVAGAGGEIVGATGNLFDEADSLASTVAATITATAALVDAGDYLTAAAGQPSLNADGALFTDDSIAGAAAAALAATSAMAEISDAIASVAADLVGANATLADEDDRVAAGGTVALAAAGALVEAADSLQAAAAAALAATSALQENPDSIVAQAHLVTSANSLSAQHRSWLEILARVHGLLAPLAVDSSGAGQRTDGTLVQNVIQSGAMVTTTTLAAPDGPDGPTALQADEAMWLEQLVRLYGAIDPLVTTATGRSDGTVTQSFTVAGTVTTIETEP